LTSNSQSGSVKGSVASVAFIGGMKSGIGVSRAAERSISPGGFGGDSSKAGVTPASTSSFVRPVFTLAG
jgi:hypothetical protein